MQEVLLGNVIAQEVLRGVLKLIVIVIIMIVKGKTFSIK